MPLCTGTHCLFWQTRAMIFNITMARGSFDRLLSISCYPKGLIGSATGSSCWVGNLSRFRQSSRTNINFRASGEVYEGHRYNIFPIHLPQYCLPGRIWSTEEREDGILELKMIISHPSWIKYYYHSFQIPIVLLFGSSSSRVWEPDKHSETVLLVPDIF